MMKYSWKNFFHSSKEFLVKAQLFLIFFFFNLTVYAQDDNGADGDSSWLDRLQNLGQAKDWQEMLESFASTFPALQKLITGAAYVLGMIFAIRALYYLKIYGELRTMMSSNASLRPPLTYLLVAAVFLFLPTSMETLLYTAFGSAEATPLSYATETGSPYYGTAIKVILAFIQLIGYIAFVRGWLIISHTAQQTGRESIGKGITHIVGGILAINIVGTRDIIWHTFGWS